MIAIRQRDSKPLCAARCDVTMQAEAEVGLLNSLIHSRGTPLRLSFPFVKPGDERTRRRGRREAAARRYRSGAWDWPGPQEARGTAELLGLVTEHLPVQSPGRWAAEEGERVGWGRPAHIPSRVPAEPHRNGHWVGQPDASGPGRRRLLLFAGSCTPSARSQVREGGDRWQFSGSRV